MHASRLDTDSTVGRLFNELAAWPPGAWVPAPSLAETVGSLAIGTDVAMLRQRLRESPQPTGRGLAVDVENDMQPGEGRRKRSRYRLVYTEGGL